jgi:L-amino acid N-acyltransferase YncA
VRRREWLQLTRTLLERIPPSLLGYNRIAIVRLAHVPEMRLRLERFETRLAGPADIPALARIQPRSWYASKLAEGDLCTICWAEGEPAAMSWFYPGEAHHSAPNAFDFRLGPRGCWSYWVTVHPDHRMRGALARLWVDSMRILRERGIDVVYSGIEEANQASLRAHCRLGFQVLCRLSVFRLAGLTLHRVGPLDGPRPWRAGRWRGADPEPLPTSPPAASR